METSSQELDSESDEVLDAELATSLIDEARDLFAEDGKIEFDEAEDPLSAISTGDTVGDIESAGGLYIRAWHWLSLSDMSPELYERITGREKGSNA